MRLILRILDGGLADRTFELGDGNLVIGRGQGCDVRLDPIQDVIASKVHCRIEAVPGGFRLTDADSANGTILNGEPIMSAELKSGDLVQFGRTGVTARVEILEGAPDAARGMTPLAPPVTVGAMSVPLPLNLSNSFIGVGGQGAVQPVADEGMSWGAIAGSVVGFGVVLVMAFLVVLFIAADTGLFAALLAAFIAFPAALLYIIPLIGLDRYDPEPAWLLGLSFTWGGVVAVLLSLILNTSVSMITFLTSGSEVLAAIVGGVISAPVVEEATKGIGVLAIMLFFKKYFDDVLDGIVYAGFVALGFATVENVLYYGREMSGGLGSVLGIVVLRGGLAPYSHVLFTAMIGIGCGIARETHRTWLKVLGPVAGYFAAVALHALWNGMALLLDNFFLGYLLIQVPLFLALCCFALFVMVRQSRIIRDMLVLDVAQGVVSQKEVDVATSWFKSTPWKLAGIFGGKGLARHRFVKALGKLGLSRWHIARAEKAGGTTISLQQNPILRAQVVKLRGQI